MDVPVVADVMVRYAPGFAAIQGLPLLALTVRMMVAARGVARHASVAVSKSVSPGLVLGAKESFVPAKLALRYGSGCEAFGAEPRL